MELYNFFSEVVNEKDADKLFDLKTAFEEIKELKPVFVDMISRVNIYGNKDFSIIGQIYGEDTSLGDLDLSIAFDTIKYTWFDAYCTSINNLS